MKTSVDSLTRLSTATDALVRPIMRLFAVMDWVKSPSCWIIELAMHSVSSYGSIRGVAR